MQVQTLQFAYVIEDELSGGDCVGVPAGSGIGNVCVFVKHGYGHTD